MIYIIAIALIVILIISASEGSKFRDNSRRLQVGMDTNAVAQIMGTPNITKTYPFGGFEWVYEHSEWKGIFRGGTQTRRLELVFDENGILRSIGKNENVDKSGW